MNNIFYRVSNVDTQQGLWYDQSGKFTGQKCIHCNGTGTVRGEGCWGCDGTGIPTPEFADVETYDIYKDPITDDGTKKSLKGLLQVFQDENGEYQVKQQCTLEEESKGVLQVIYENGKFFNQITLTEVRNKLK